MNDDPVRWKDDEEAPHEVRPLLDPSHVEQAIPAAVRAKIAASLSAPPAPVATEVPRGRGGHLAPWKFAAVAGAIAALGLATQVVLRQASRDARLPTDVGSVSAAPSPTAPAPSAAPAGVDAAIQLEPDPAPGATDVTPSGSVSVHRRTHPSSAPVPTRPDDLARESALVGRARAMVAPDPAGAIRVLDEHGRLFPRGELASEREYLRFGALRRLGRDREAAATATRFLDRYPSSPYASTIRSALTELEQK